MIVDSSVLNGLSYGKASLYGMPHLGAVYTGKSVGDYKRTVSRCVICGRPATNCHHVVPLSVGRRFELGTPRGTFRLRPPLFALCGSGTTGCHNGFHGGARFVPRWVWDSEECEGMWWSGELLERCGAHSPELFGYGHWEIKDRKTGLTLVYKMGA